MGFLLLCPFPLCWIKWIYFMFKNVNLIAALKLFNLCSPGQYVDFRVLGFTHCLSVLYSLFGFTLFITAPDQALSSYFTHTVLLDISLCVFSFYPHSFFLASFIHSGLSSFQCWGSIGGGFFFFLPFLFLSERLWKVNWVFFPSQCLYFFSLVLSANLIRGRTQVWNSLNT